MKKILFVCLGNICRSPLAEAIFSHKTQGLNYSCDSAGTAAYHIGKQPDHRSIQVAEENGIPISHRARQFQAEDFEDFDFVIAMDRSNYSNMKALVNYEPKNLYYMRDFDPEANGDLDVPDPYYGGIDGFNLIFQMMSRSIDNLIAHLDSEK
ncbi:low molecular weight protein-tyrosine-phosphatase [Reichenbachiella versicolor]|uniref:low molecular weight protein-tyrosine-phosphatase n=1 Tax=Reichenbachiella versicolor TaxID=1821036 RepID=UPI000D6E9728|nr:low molecular weight protein-tyrosine-phosphatase [Reichenbachiella versicolor]